ncbi:hypothetical protein DFQ26_003793 [Actinomortierella ambigua]|nr:hypothetical protein DFQ26_003793 [Actinomortierella ambigua]
MDTTLGTGAEGVMSGATSSAARTGPQATTSSGHERVWSPNERYDSILEKKEERDGGNGDEDRRSGGASLDGADELGRSQSTLAPFDPDSKEVLRLRRKVDRHLMPLLTIIYLCSYLDRANIGLSIFYFAYVLGEIPSSILVKKVGPALWISIVISLWGIVMMSMSALKNGAGLLAARFFLGLFESGYAPAPVVMISLWYNRLEQAFRIGIFFSAATVAGACAGLLAYGIAQLDGVLGLKAWSWIFLIEGGVTVLVAIIAFFWLPNLPETSSFLTDREKSLLVERLRQDAGPAIQTHFSWKQLRRVYMDPKTYLYSFVILLHAPAFASLGLFVPSIVHGFNFDPVTTQLMTAPIWAVACVVTLLCTLSSDRLMGRGNHAAVCVLAALVGYILLIFIPESDLVGRYLSLTLCTSGVYACLPVLLSWPSSNVGGHTKRNVTIGTVISISAK